MSSFAAIRPRNFERWCEDLWEFARLYDADTSRRIAGQARELFEDKTIVYIVEQHAKLRRDAVATAKSEFDRMLQGINDYPVAKSKFLKASYWQAPLQHLLVDNPDQYWCLQESNTEKSALPLSRTCP